MHKAPNDELGPRIRLSNTAHLCTDLLAGSASHARNYRRTGVQEQCVFPGAAQAKEASLIRTFMHSFFPASANPIKGALAELTVDEIEDAGIREVLQTPGASLGSWAILDSLLEPTGPGSPFVFREPLGQAREVKVALSGLFGRFIARAYLERSFGLAIFAHPGQRKIVLDGRRRIEIIRKTRGERERPNTDWLVLRDGIANDIVNARAEQPRVVTDA